MLLRHALLCMLSVGCWTGPYASYSVTASTDFSWSITADETWYAFDVVHDTTFHMEDAAPTNAELRDSGDSILSLSATPTDGSGPLEVETFYYRCDGDFDFSAPRQAGEAWFDTSGEAILEREIDFVGAQKLGDGSGGAFNCMPGFEPIQVLVVRLAAPQGGNWTVDGDLEVSLFRDYPEKYWRVQKGELSVTPRPTTAEEAGWLP